MNKRYKVAEIVVSVVALMLVIVVAAVLGALKIGGVLDIPVNPFLLIFTIITLGFGVYLTIFALIKKGGYELAVATILDVIGVVLLFIALKINPIITVIVAIVVAILGFLTLFLLKAKSLVVERTDEKPDYVPYSAQNQSEETEEEPLPVIKSFKE